MPEQKEPPAMKKIRRKPKTKGGICQNPPFGRIGKEVITPMRRKKVGKPAELPVGGGASMTGGAFVPVTKAELKDILKKDPKRFVIYRK